MAPQTFCTQLYSKGIVTVNEHLTTSKRQPKKDFLENLKHKLTKLGVKK